MLLFEGSEAFLGEEKAFISTRRPATFLLRRLTLLIVKTIHNKKRFLGPGFLPTPPQNYLLLIFTKVE